MNLKTTVLHMAALVAIALPLLTGCQKQNETPFFAQGSAEDHRTSFSGGEALRLPASTWHRSSSPVSEGGDLQYYVDERGTRIPKSYYVVYCDIFYKLDWIRSQLRKGIVPPSFGTKLQSVRKELTLATTGITRDGNYKVADEGLTLLEHGYQHYLTEGELAASGAQISLAPWSVGRGAMQRYIDAGALGFGAKSIANTMPGAESGPDVSHPDASLDLQVGDTSKALTNRQRNAIAILLQYATEFHQSPHECAKADWSKAAVKINKLGDQLWVIKPSNRDTGSTVDVRPNSGSDSSAGIFDVSASNARRNGADLHGVPAPVGDPFLTTSPSIESLGHGSSSARTP